jgi:hypothetical protein
MADEVTGLISSRTLEQVVAELERAKAHLAEIREAMSAFEVLETTEAVSEALGREAWDGKGLMLPAVPSSEQWQSRSKKPEKDYLFLLFPKARYGTYTGPINKNEKPARKVYVGSKKDAAGLARITRGRRMAENRRRWERLNEAAQRLESWIGREEASVRNQVERMLGDSKDWTCRYRLDLVGLVPAGAVDVRVDKDVS